ncbi:hypothetical protein MMC17_005982 [Xylographa soralifera]|nr:hypothetical protein [Xylographa soralifera]
MDSSRLNYLSTHYVDDLDMQVATLEIRARRRFQQERDLYRHSVGIATTKLQQYCLGLILSHHGPNSAIYALVEEAARRSGLPVELWSMHEVKRVWDDIVMLQRAYTQARAEEPEPQEHQDPPLYTEPEYPKLKAGNAPQQHGGGGATRERVVPRPPDAYSEDESQDSNPPVTRFPWDDLPIKAAEKAGHKIDSARDATQDSNPPVTKFPWDDVPIGAARKTGHKVDSAMAQVGEKPGGLPLPLTRKKGPTKNRSPKELQAELQREPRTKEVKSAQAAADKEGDTRLEAEAEKQRKEDAEIAERERAAAAAARAKEEDDKAKGVLNPVQQMEMDEARKIFQGELSESEQKILADAKKEFGEDIMEWGLKETKRILNKIILGT